MLANRQSSRWKHYPCWWKFKPSDIHRALRRIWSHRLKRSSSGDCRQSWVLNYAYNPSYSCWWLSCRLSPPLCDAGLQLEWLGDLWLFQLHRHLFYPLGTTLVANYGQGQDTGKISEEFLELYPPVRGLRFYLLPSMMFFCLLTFHTKIPFAYILGLSLVSKGLDISWLFQGLEDFHRLQFGISRSTSWSHLHLLVSNLPMICIYVFLLTIFELLGQLSMWLPARSSLEAHLI